MKAVIILAAALCSACAPDAPVKVEYVCSSAQREAAQVEAQREISITKAWDSVIRKDLYDQALARNCVVKP
ncbi:MULTISPECIES: hypothetical protein [unclassified Massilia]|uniref:hypothetical protein n=1 Tax=Massilia TaxID=149698 RepID=UPI001422F632|nr:MULTISPECIES: hypothetical protein [unclassified Massilia]MCY0910878.1 hypothetical protein [Massilia sp. H27-R4]NHZ94599.1 hypothetical protein [Massilia sp. CCM 8734]